MLTSLASSGTAANVILLSAALLVRGAGPEPEKVGQLKNGDGCADDNRQVQHVFAFDSSEKSKESRYRDHCQKCPLHGPVFDLFLPLIPVLGPDGGDFHEYS